jgi:predicted metal-dependent hydrolase
MIKKQIKLADQEIVYTLKTSLRAKQLRLSIYCDGSLAVTRPRVFNADLIDQFLRAKMSWILKKLEQFKTTPVSPLNSLNRRDYLNNRAKFRLLLIERLEYFNNFYNFEYGKITIRNQKTRWGSCSRQGNLNFNFRLFYLAAPVRDYVIVHELCHLKEFNHSESFWGLVAQTMPDFKSLRNKLKNG